MASSKPRKIQYQPSNELLNSIKARVDRYFSVTGRRARDCTGMYVKTAIILGAFVASYVLLVFFATTWLLALPLALLLGLAIAAIGFNIQHDGGHQAYSKHRWVNRVMASFLDLMGASSLVWARKHNNLHHTYTNLDGHDDDIDVGIWGRLSPHQRHRFFHRLQHLYIWALYPMLVAKWQVYDDFRDVILGRIGEHRMQRPRGWEIVLFVGGKLVFFSLAFLLPLMFHPFLTVLLYYAVTIGTAGLVLSVVFQLAHVVEETQFDEPPEDGRMPTAWAVHQLRTTADFAPRNRLLCWYVGGLNFQVEHHLFPRICHLHYPKIARIVERACRKAGVEYHSFPSVGAAIGSHYRWLRTMGRPPHAA